MAGPEQSTRGGRDRFHVAINSIRTHALERLGRWQECLDTCARAMSECGQLHHDNDIWFARTAGDRAKRGRWRLARCCTHGPDGPPTFFPTGSPHWTIPQLFRWASHSNRLSDYALPSKICRKPAGEHVGLRDGTPDCRRRARRTPSTVFMKLTRCSNEPRPELPHRVIAPEKRNPPPVVRWTRMVGRDAALRPTNGRSPCLSSHSRGNPPRNPRAWEAIGSTYRCMLQTVRTAIFRSGSRPQTGTDPTPLRNAHGRKAPRFGSILVTGMSGLSEYRLKVGLQACHSPPACLHPATHWRNPRSAPQEATARPRTQQRTRPCEDPRPWRRAGPHRRGLPSPRWRRGPGGQAR